MGKQAKMRRPIKPAPLSVSGRVLIFIMLLLLALIWVTGLYAYYTLPEQVPTRFGFSGKPDAIGSKQVFLYLPPAFSIAPVVFLFLIRYRFPLINKYPYLVSLPEFFSILDLPSERRAYWLNRYFELVLMLGVALAIFLLVMLIGIFKGTLDGAMPSWFTALTVALPFGLVVPIVFALRSLSMKMAEEGRV